MKKRCFLGFLSILFSAFLSLNAFAADCAANHYTDTNGVCTPCPANSHSNGGDTPTCTCDDGFTITGLTDGDTETTNNACVTISDFVIKTTSNINNFSFTIYAPGSYTVDWGDGTIETGGAKTFSHTYAVAKEYIIGLSGEQSAYYGDGGRVISFENNTNIVSLYGSLGIIFNKGSSRSTFSATFNGCTSLESIPSTLFDGASDFYAENMFYSTFKNCSSLKFIPEGLFDWVTKSSNNQFEATFYGCSSLEKLPDGLFKNITGQSGSDAFNGTFSNCTSLSGYVPANMFQNLTNRYAINFMTGIFDNTNLATSCPSDTYQYKTGFETYWSGKVSCATCPDAYPYLDDNATSINACYLITESGQYVPNGGMNPVICDRGLYCPGNTTVHYGDSGGSTPCPANYFCPAGATEPTPCPANSSTNGATGQAFCSCAGGYYGNGATCTACPENHFCPDGATEPIACPAYSHSDVGATVCTCDDGYSLSGYVADPNRETTTRDCEFMKYSVWYWMPPKNSPPDIYVHENMPYTQPVNLLTSDQAKEMVSSLWPGEGYKIKKWVEYIWVENIGSVPTDIKFDPGQLVTVDNLREGRSSMELAAEFECAAGYYGDGETCTACPEHSTSVDGATVCTCDDGYRMADNVCEPCPNGVCVDPAPIRPTCNAGYHVDESTNTCVGNTLNIVFQNGGSYNYEVSDLPAGLRVTHGEPVPVLSGLETIGPDMHYQEVVAAGTAKMGVKNWAFDGVPAWLADGSVDTYSMGTNPIVSTALFPESGDLTVSPEWKTIELKCNAGYYNTGRSNIGKGNCTPCPTTGNQVCPGMTEFKSTSEKSGIETCGANSSPNDAHTECVCNPGYAQDTITGICTEKTYTIKYDDNTVDLFNYFDQYTIRTPDARDGYVFEYWVDDNDTQYTAGQTISGSGLTDIDIITLTGVWHCAAGYYGNGTTCTACPEHSTSTEGSDYCTCDAGYYGNGNTCTICLAGSYCPGSTTTPMACPTEYNTSDAGATQESECYLTTTEGNWVASAYAQQAPCPENSYCPGGVKINYGGTGGATQCPPDDYPYSAAGSKEVNDCYKNCEDAHVENGMAHPEADRAPYQTECTYSEGTSRLGNPCNIIMKDGDRFCYEPNCPFDQEMLTPGVCEPCNVAHADKYDEDAHGNCIVKTCDDVRYTPYLNECLEKEKQCTAEHATKAYRSWDENYLAYGPCLVKECAENYHIDANACESNISPCDIKNGVGERKWEGSNWSACYVKRCERGFTENADGTQCLRCYNYYDEYDNVAVSSYIKECDIATCMYQGEKYILKDNECSLICTDKEDETGSRHWDEQTQKCEHTCNDGYLQW